MQVFKRVGGTDMSLRDVTIAQMGNRATECGWCHAPEARGGFWKSQLVGLRTGHRMRTGSRWKSQNRKNVYLSPYVEEPLNLKLIKSFIPELRSRVFHVSRFQCICYIYVYFTHIHIMGMVHIYIMRHIHTHTHTHTLLWFFNIAHAKIVLCSILKMGNIKFGIFL